MCGEDGRGAREWEEICRSKRNFWEVVCYWTLVKGFPKAETCDLGVGANERK